MSALQEQLQRLEITLPECPKPVAAYVPAVRSGSLIFVSGQLPFRNGQLLSTGSVPEKTDIATAQECAGQCLLNGIAAAMQVLKSGEQLENVIQINGFVQSAAGFVQHPQIINGASELALKLFGEKGRHARMALGASSLPMDAPVEIAFIFSVAEN